MHAICTRTNSLRNEFQTAATVSLQPVCVHVTACVIVFVSENKYNVARQYKMCINSQIVWYTQNEEGLKERKTNAQCACVPMPE